MTEIKLNFLGENKEGFKALCIAQIGLDIILGYSLLWWWFSAMRCLEDTDCKLRPLKLSLGLNNRVIKNLCRAYRLKGKMVCIFPYLLPE